MVQSPEERKRLVTASTKNYHRVFKAEIFALKAKGPCVDCGGIFPPECMDFDHREGTIKRDDVAGLMNQKHGRPTVMAEIAKCDLVCANCHRVRTTRRIRQRLSAAS